MRLEKQHQVNNDRFLLQHQKTNDRFLGYHKIDDNDQNAKGILVDDDALNEKEKINSSLTISGVAVFCRQEEASSSWSSKKEGFLLELRIHTRKYT